MGPDATYHVTWHGMTPSRNEVADELATHQTPGGPGNLGATLDLIDGRRGGHWPDWQQSMLAVSRRWPETAFTVERYGWDLGDHLAAYFMDGRTYQRELTPEPLNPALLPEEVERTDSASHDSYHFLHVPPGTGAAPWLRQMNRECPVTDANRREIQHMVTFVTGGPPPDSVPSSGTSCIHDGDDRGDHGPAVAHTWQFEIPSSTGEKSYNGFAGYCAPCLLESYGISLAQVQEIFGIG